MINVTNLTKSFGGQVLYDDITFNINRGEKIGLIGRNGHGKTTLFSLLLERMHPDSGSISIPNGYRIGHLEQHINFTQDTVIKEGCLGLRPEDEYDTWKVEKILFGLGFSKDDMEKHPSTFSGGFQIRLNLAKVLVSEPNLLLLDEPNNYLDIVAARWLIDFLRSWRDELMLITHDRGFMDSVTTHTLGIHRKKVRKVKGSTEKLYNQLAVEEEVYEKTRLNDESKRRQLEVFINRFRANARLAGQVQSKVKVLEKMGEKESLEKLETLKFNFNSLYFNSAQLLSTEEMSFSYGNKAPYLINDFSLNVGKNERICVTGKNGKGKSTLLKILAGELEPVSGKIKINPKIKTGYFGQLNLQRLNPGNTVLDEIMASSKECFPQTARNIAGRLMFRGDHALKPVSVLSGGEKNRVMLAKIVVTPCHLLLLDEPTNHLDMDSCDALMEALEKFDGSVIIVTHNETFLKNLAKRLIVFDRDTVKVYEGGYQDFLDNVGWMDEDEAKKEAKEKKLKEAPAKQPPVPLRVAALQGFTSAPAKNKTEAKKKRYNGEAAELENKIYALETEMHENNNILIKASYEGNAPLITAAAKKNAGLKKEIDSLYDKLDKLTVKI